MPTVENLRHFSLLSTIAMSHASNVAAVLLLSRQQETLYRRTRRRRRRKTRGRTRQRSTVTTQISQLSQAPQRAERRYQQYAIRICEIENGNTTLPPVASLSWKSSVRTAEYFVLSPLVLKSQANRNDQEYTNTTNNFFYTSTEL